MTLNFDWSACTKSALGHMNRNYGDSRRPHTPKYRIYFTQVVSHRLGLSCGWIRLFSVIIQSSMSVSNPVAFAQIVKPCNEHERKVVYNCLTPFLGEDGGPQRTPTAVLLRSLAIHVISLILYDHLMSMQVSCLYTTRSLLPWFCCSFSILNGLSYSSSRVV